MLYPPPSPTAHPSFAAARSYLATRRGFVRLQYDSMQVRRDGFAIFFTIVSPGGRFAYVVKLCEDRHGRVTGSSDVSHGEPSC